MKSWLKTLAGIELDYTLRVGLSSWIKNISWTRQSNLFLHFIKMLKLLNKIFWSQGMFVMKVVANWRVLMFFNSLVKMVACEANITCIVQVAFKFVNNALLVHNCVLSFSQFEILFNLLAVQSCGSSDLNLKVEHTQYELSANRRPTVFVTFQAKMMADCSPIVDHQSATCWQPVGGS